MSAPAPLVPPPSGHDEMVEPSPFADTSPRRPPTWRRVVTVLAWTVAVTLGGLLVALAAGRPAPDEYLHPDGTGPGGTRALVEVLREQGIDVDVVGTSEEVLDASGPGTTVVVGNTDLLTGTSAERVLDSTRDADRLVLLDAAPGLLDDLDVGLRVEPTAAEPRPGCTASWADDGDRLSRASWAVVPEGGSLPGDATGCFPLDAPRDAEDPQVARYAVVDLPGTSARAPLTVVAAPDAATNRFITEDDDAGLLVRLLGGSPRLVWFHPTAQDLAANPSPDEESPWPPWLGSALAVSGVAVVVFALARGRRLGRLVPEPLPVVVRAAETTESRAELYRAAQDLPRAAMVLRRATATRLASRLGLPAAAPPATLVPAVVAATGVPTAHVEALLVGPLPDDETALVTLAQQLAHLEEKARRP
jgi:hypothetical protein